MAVGDRVAYILGRSAAMPRRASTPANRLIKLSEDAAAVLFKRITAQYLIKKHLPGPQGATVLAYGVTGGVGQILVPWTKKHLGATVIWVVSNKASVERAKQVGCDAVTPSRR